MPCSSTTLESESFTLEETDGEFIEEVSEDEVLEDALTPICIAATQVAIHVQDVFAIQSHIDSAKGVLIQFFVFTFPLIPLVLF